MSAKFAQLRVYAGGANTATALRPRPATINVARVGFAAVVPRKRRPILACRWHQAQPGGALECTWHVEPADGSGAAENGISRLVKSLLRARRRSTRQTLAAAAVM